MNKLHIRKARAEERGQPPIFFDEQPAGRTAQGKLRERAQPRTEFDPRLIRLEIALRDDPFREVLVVQEILAEAARRLHADLRETGRNGGELHGTKQSLIAGTRKRRGKTQAEWLSPVPINVHAASAKIPKAACVLAVRQCFQIITHIFRTGSTEVDRRKAVAFEPGGFTEFSPGSLERSDRTRDGSEPARVFAASANPCRTRILAE